MTFRSRLSVLISLVDGLGMRQIFFMNSICFIIFLEGDEGCAI